MSRYSILESSLRSCVNVILDMTGTQCEFTRQIHCASQQLVHDAGSCTAKFGPHHEPPVSIDLTTG